jgi:hypothetical protein
LASQLRVKLGMIRPPISAIITVATPSASRTPKPSKAGQKFPA